MLGGYGRWVDKGRVGAMDFSVGLSMRATHIPQSTDSKIVPKSRSYVVYDRNTGDILHVHHQITFPNSASLREPSRSVPAGLRAVRQAQTPKSSKSKPPRSIIAGPFGSTLSSESSACQDDSDHLLSQALWLLSADIPGFQGQMG